MDGGLGGHAHSQGCWTLYPEVSTQIRGHVPFAWYVTGATQSSAAWPWGGGRQVGGLLGGKTDEEAAETSLVVQW